MERFADVIDRAQAHIASACLKLAGDPSPEAGTFW